ncbi:uncharacterized protein KY384_006593 [Bacidia gigantensis]|uniref:uncharacterized protein n=1 Tax=Bacidia gigantensis TaxID=2732470 RepID=UPI001D03D953|nr:uncharacterized protein KY384_006593 [Bacidia gigantensis]KAG8528904.1 hypothetical protein KY384_006593 [Bacidia gigantensis]
MSSTVEKALPDSQVAAAMFSSPLIAIDVGTKGDVLYAHAAKLMRSDVMDKMITGDFKEAHECRIELKEWDIDTVARLLEWFYSEDYKVAYPREASPVASGGIPTGNVIISPPDADPSPPVSNSPSESKSQIVADSPAPEFTRFPEFAKWAQDHTDIASDISHSEALLAHGKVCALAEYLNLPGLMRLASHHIKNYIDLIETLKLNMHLVDELVTLMRYLYANTSGYGLGKKSIRDRLAFTVANHSDLFTGPISKEAIGEGGELMQDVMHYIQKYHAENERPVTVTKRGAPTTTPTGRGKKAKTGN